MSERRCSREDIIAFRWDVDEGREWHGEASASHVVQQLCAISLRKMLRVPDGSWQLATRGATRLGEARRDRERRDQRRLGLPWKMTVGRRLVRVLCVLLCLSLRPDYAYSTHITGTFNTREFFRFLIKFGFQKTDRHRQKDSYGYIFGNVTARTDFDVPITLAILDRGHFLEYYGNRTLTDKSAACAYMFNTLKKSSYDPDCNEDGQDFLRYIWCFNLLHYWCFPARATDDIDCISLGIHNS